LDLVASNVVIAAEFFNPSLFSQVWLIKNKFVAEEAFAAKGNIHSDALAKVVTDNFSLVLVPNQLQFTPRCSVQDSGELVKKVVGGIVSALEHTPYTGVGLNFVWHAGTEKDLAPKLSRDLFYRDSIELFNEFDEETALFGAYLCKDIDGGRLTLDIKPIIRSAADAEKQTILQFSFNFHKDLNKNDPVPEAIAHLKMWSDYFDNAERIIGIINGEGQ
jgi:hypothetical protein